MPGPWKDLDLSTAFFYTSFSGTPWGKYEGGKIVTNVGWPDFSIPAFTLDKGATYEVEVTYDASFDDTTNGTFFYGIQGLTQEEYNTGGSWYDLSEGPYAGAPFETTDGYTMTFLLGVEDWWYAAHYYGSINPLIESSRYGGLTAMRYRQLSSAAGPHKILNHHIIGGSTVGTGGSSSASATPIGLNQVSAPNHLAFDEEAWYSFTPTESGLVIIDSVLSYDYELGAMDSWLSGYMEIHEDGAYFSSGNPAQVAQVTAGKTYQIFIHNYNDASNDAIAYVRVSSYGTGTDWIDLGVNEIVLNSGVSNPHYVPTLSVNTTTGGGDGSIPSVDPYHGTYGGGATYNLWQAFGGPIPMSDSSSWSCGWHWARRGLAGTQWWSVDGGVSWGGSGTCMTYPDSTQPDIMGGGGIGISASSDAGGFLLPAFTHFSSQSMAIYVSLHNITRQLGKYAGRFFRQDVEVPDMPNAYLIWESEGDCTIEEFAVAPDEPLEYSNPTTRVKWWMNYTKDNFVDTNENPAGYWGPSRYSGGFSPVWRGNGDGPEGAYGRAHQVLPEYSGGTADWTVIDQTFIDAAYAFEEDNDWYYPTPPDRAALRFIGIHHALTSDVLPSELSLPTAIPGSTTDRRDYQGLAMKVKAQPVRHRWMNPPDLPPLDVTSSGGWIVGEDLVSA